MQNTGERKEVSREKECMSKVQDFILVYIDFNIL